MKDLTLKQRQVVQLIEAGLSQYKAAAFLGVTRATVQSQLNQARDKGWRKSTGDAITPDKMQMHGQSVLYDADGNAKLAWHKYSPERAFSADFVEGLVKRAKDQGNLPTKRPSPKYANDSICAEVCVYDLHFGMYASADDTGDSNYDTDIAARRLMQSIEDLATRLNKPHTIRLILGGDTLHMDDSSNATKASKHQLDVDTRYNLVIKKLIAAVYDAVCLLSLYAPNLEIYVIEGNHDQESSRWLAQVLEAFWWQEERITVCDQSTPRKYATWGDCLSCYGHGDKLKADHWAKVVAAEQAQLWGQTKHRYARLGHVHTRKVIPPYVVDESSGLEVTFLSSLASSDSWHASMGYIGNKRGTQAFELHKTKGQVSQLYYNI